MSPSGGPKPIPDDKIRDLQLFSRHVLPELQMRTGLPRGQIAELILDFTIEKLALMLSHDLSTPLRKQPREIENDIIDMLTTDPEMDPESAVRSVILKANKDPNEVLKRVDVDKRILDARVKAVEAILDDFEDPDYEEATDPRLAARRALLRGFQKERGEAEKKWSQAGGSEQDYLDPKEIEKERALGKAVEKKGGMQAFQQWLRKHHPDIDWETLAKQAEEEAKGREKEFMRVLTSKAKSALTSKEKAQLTGQPLYPQIPIALPDEPEEPQPEAEPRATGPSLSDEELDAFLADNPVWAQALEEDPSWRQRIKDDPSIISSLSSFEFEGEIDEGIDFEKDNPYPRLGPEDKDKLAQLATRIRPGGLKLPLRFFLWRFNHDREKNINASLDEFIKGFFDPEQVKNMSVDELLRYGVEKPLSKRRLADLTKFSAQTLTVRSKKIKKAADVQDPEAVLQYLEPRRATAKGGPGAGQIARVPDWVIDIFEPILVTSDDFITDVSDLAEKIMDWSKDPKVRSRVELELEKERLQGKDITVDWDRDDPGNAFATALGIVARAKAPQIASDLVSGVDVALAALDDHLEKTKDPDILIPVGEGPLDWRAAMKRFFDPQVDRVLAVHGLSYIMGGSLIGRLKEEIRPLIIKHMREKGDQSAKELSPGQRLFSAIVEKVEALLTNKEMLETLVGPGEIRKQAGKGPTTSGMRGGMEAPYMIKPSLRRRILQRTSATTPAESTVAEAKKDRVVHIRQGDITKTKALFKSKLRKLSDEPSVGELRDWFKSLPKSGRQGKASAKDLVRLLSFWLG